MYESFGTDGADVILECVGSPKAIQEAVQYAPRGARIVVTGVFTEQVPLNVGFIQDHELEIRGIVGYTIRDFRTALQLIQKNSIQVMPLKMLIMKRFPLQKVMEAYKFIEHNQPSVLKVMLEV